MCIKKLIIVFLILLAVLCIGTASSFASEEIIENVIGETETNVVNENTNTEIVKADIDLLQIIDEATKTPKKEQLIVEQVDLEYTTSYENDNSLPKGQMQVLVEGRDGKQEIITKKTYKGEELVLEEISSEKIVKASINKIVTVGTANSSYATNYKIKKGDTAYVTSYTLNVKAEPTLESDKKGTLLREAEVKVLEVNSEWAKISSNDTVGWVNINCVTKKVPENDNVSGQYTKAQLLAKLSFGMDVSKPSGLSLEQFKKVLSGNSKDTNKVFEQNAEIFYYIEQQYKINGVFVAAIGIHESAFGTSKISLDKRNLFGYGAYDSTPYDSAYDFETYSEGIDLVARVLVKYYLNSEGTAIYDGQAASGKYYNGTTLSAVNKRYATSKGWANGVYNWMKYLYEKL